MYQGQGYGANQQQRQYNDQLKPLANMGFPYNNLMTVGMVQRIPPANMRTPDLKDKVFFFITMAPGVGSQQQRTYDFKQKISLKFGTREIAELAFVLQECARGNERSVLPYTKFTSTKNLSVWVPPPKMQQMGQQQVSIKTINISVKGAASHTIGLSPAQAYGMGSILNKLFDRAIQVELEVQSQSPALSSNFYNEGGDGQPQQFNQNTLNQQGPFGGQPDQSTPNNTQYSAPTYNQSNTINPSFGQPVADTTQGQPNSYFNR